jgi:hypothetical protein
VYQSICNLTRDITHMAPAAPQPPTLQLANGIALGYTVAGIAPNMDAANAMLPAIVTLHLFFAGQLKTYDSIPK